MSDQNNARIIEFPKINLAELGSLPKGEVAGKIRGALKSLIEVQMLKLTNFLNKDTLDRAEEISNQLEELKSQYPQLIGVTQNLLGQQIKDLAEKKGDSRTLFDRLRILAIEATFQGALQEWDEKDLSRVPMGLRQNFMVQIFNPKTRETIYLLPRNWRNSIHKRIALILRDLSFKARDTYRTERGIQTPAETSKPEIPAKTQKPKSQPKPKAAPKPKTTAKPQSKKKDEADVKAAKRTKAVKVEDEGKEAEKEIRDAKKGISLANDPDALDFLKK